MDCETESDSTSSTSEYGECTPWQDSEALCMQKSLESDEIREEAYEEYIKELMDEWLSQHGKALFSLESSKFLHREKKTCSLKPAVKRRLNYRSDYESKTGFTLEGSPVIKTD